MDSDKTDWMDDESRREEWDTHSLQEDFEVIGFLAPYVVVIRKSDGVRGTLQFDHHPRVYYNWQEGTI